MPGDGKPESNPYFIATEENATEVARLVYQKQLTIQAQGELLPDGLDLRRVRTVLDLACGPGTWAMEMAMAFPHMQLVGVDLSSTMLHHATLYAQVDTLPNVRFLQMDIRRGLAFPDAAFDLINADYLQSFMRPADWLPLLAECRRVLRPGGVLKLGELEGGVSTGAATDALYAIWARAMKAAGRTFSSDGQHLGITAMLRPLLLESHYERIQHKAYAVDYSTHSGADVHQGFLEDVIMLCRHMGPFVVQTLGQVQADEMQRLIEQARAEMEQPDFCCLVYRLDAWGYTPGDTTRSRWERSER